MKTKLTFLLLLVVMTWGCKQQSATKKHYKEYNKVINLKEKLQPIEIKEVFIGDFARLYLMYDYLIISDHHAQDKLIHLFDRNNFKYVLSTGNKGKGPGEITIVGHIAADEAHRKFYVTDHGKSRIFSYDLDSLLADPLYLPTVKVNLSESLSPIDYKYINDTLCFGRIWKIIGNNDFKPYVGKWNMLTNEIQLMKYEHPDVKKKRVLCDISPDFGLYIEAHDRYDLITVGTLNGELKYNIYGPHWEKKLTKNHYYSSTRFCKDKIITTYLAAYGFVKESNGRIRSKCPSKFIIFDLAGNYLQTWEIGHEITNFVYDEENNRLIMGLEDAEVQFAYLNLDGLL